MGSMRVHTASRATAFCAVLSFALPFGAHAQIGAPAAGGGAETAPASGGHGASGGRVNNMGDAKGKPPASARAQEADSKAARSGPQDSQRIQLSAVDRKLMRALAQAHLAEIKMSGLAAAISSNEAVHAYAEKMLEEHLKAHDELKLLAERAAVALPGGVESGQASALHKLSLLAGKEFDQAYMEQAGLGLHKEAHQLFQDAGERAQWPELKAYAAGLVKTIDGHMRLAQRMQEDPANAAAIVQSSVLAGQSTSHRHRANASSLPQGSGGKGNSVIAGEAVVRKQ